MTDPKALRALVEAWRNEAHELNGPSTRGCLLSCADELEATLSSPPLVPAQPERLQEIQGRAEKATAGPWIWEDDGNALTYGSCQRATLYAGDRQMHGLNLLGRLEPDWNGFNNLQFIAHAREDVSWLLAQVATLTASCASLEQSKKELKAIISAGQAANREQASRLDQLRVLKEAAEASCAEQARELARLKGGQDT